MCLAVPLKLVEIHGNSAMTREIRVDFIPEPKVGDYVMVHAGFAIDRLDEQQAQEDIDAWKEVQDALG